MTPQQHAQAAAALRDAARTGAFIAPLREQFPDMTADDAYAIQKINTDLRVSGGCVMCRRSAARAKLRSCARARKRRICLRSMGRSPLSIDPIPEGYQPRKNRYWTVSRRLGIIALHKETPIP